MKASLQSFWNSTTGQDVAGFWLLIAFAIILYAELTGSLIDWEHESLVVFGLLILMDEIGLLMIAGLILFQRWLYSPPKPSGIKVIDLIAKTERDHSEKHRAITAVAIANGNPRLPAAHSRR